MSKNHLKKYTFEIENYYGETVMAFEIAIFQDGKIGITKNLDCNLADVDGDYIFNSENALYRIQYEGARNELFKNKADLTEVKHGMWLFNRNQAPNEMLYFCSLCAYGESDTGKDNYCPCCGAKMDLKEEA